MSDNAEQDNPSDNPFKQKTIICTKGKTIFDQNSPAHEAFHLEEGQARVTIEEDGHKITLADIEPGEIFGEMGIIEQAPRLATVEAVTSCTLTVITKDDLQKKLDVIDDKYVKALIKTLIKRLRQSNIQQVGYHKELSEFQDRITGLMEKSKSGIDSTKRDEFRAEIAPLLNQLDEVLEKYKP